MSGLTPEQYAHFMLLAQDDRVAAREYRDGIVAAKRTAYLNSPEYAACMAQAMKECTRTESAYGEAKWLSRAQGSNVPDDHHHRINR